MIKNIIVALIVFIPAAYFLTRYFAKPSKCSCDNCPAKKNCNKISYDSNAKCPHYCEKDNEEEG